jgi:translation initiation factor IF-1
MKMSVQENYNGFILSLLGDLEKSIREMEGKFVHEDTLIKKVIKHNQQFQEMTERMNRMELKMNEMELKIKQQDEIIIQLNEQLTKKE